MMGFQDYSRLPNNKREIQSSWKDDYLEIEFEPVNIYNTVVECNYTIQLQKSVVPYNCRFNSSEEVIGEIEIPKGISVNLTSLKVQVPLNQ